MVRVEGRFPQSAKKASGTSNWVVTFDNVPPNAFYVRVVTATDNDGANTSTRGNPVPVGSPPPPIPKSVAINSASVWAITSRVPVGPPFNGMVLTHPPYPKQMGQFLSIL
jgi:hypothetical protein